ncbi:MAG: hypothetical protein ACYTF0_02515 [Planctomycetota bacterium]|jgi:hypothetical protein
MSADDGSMVTAAARMEVLAALAAAAGQVPHFADCDVELATHDDAKHERVAPRIGTIDCRNTFSAADDLYTALCLACNRLRLAGVGHFQVARVQDRPCLFAIIKVPTA